MIHHDFQVTYSPYTMLYHDYKGSCHPQTRDISGFKHHVTKLHNNMISA